MGKSQYSEANQVLKKGPWTPQEDQKLLAYIQQHGHGSWRALPNKAGLQRCGKSCRLRWKNYLRPDIKRGKFSLEEERTIIQLHALLGNRWSAIATQLPERSDNEIKNYWNTHLKKRLAMMGFDPATHKRRPAAAALACAAAAATDPKNASNLSHMAQWESARLQAERRLAKESKSSNRQVDLAEVVEATTAATPLSPGQIIKKMPTTFAPPRCFDTLEAWQSRLSSISCATRASGFGEIIVNPTAHAKSDSFYASSESSAEAVGGFGGRGAFLGHVSCLGPTEADWIHRIESSCEHYELNKSYWNDNCGPSSFSV